MTTYREALPNEADAIAQLHAASWQKHYRGILRDAYLDQEVLADRLSIWRERFQHPKETQHIIVATDSEQRCGFACTYADFHEEHGALLDNLHVSSAWQGRGIGAELIRRSAQWVYQRDETSGFYLWVFEANTSALAFYQRMGGTIQEKTMVENPGGGSAPVSRIVWPDPSVLI
ncbi:MAG: GNAT family N-acetyltransferase [Bacteroidota bacterium]